MNGKFICPYTASQLCSYESISPMSIVSHTRACKGFEQKGATLSFAAELGTLFLSWRTRAIHNDSFEASERVQPIHRGRKVSQGSDMIL